MTRCFVLLSSLVVWASAAFAQMGARPTAGPVPAVASAEPTPPRLVQHVAPQLPDGVTAAPGGHVVLELLVDEHGAVTEASAVESSEPALATAAVEAAKRFVFV